MKIMTKKYVVVLLLLSSCAYHAFVECAKKGAVKIFDDDELMMISKSTREISDDEFKKYMLYDKQMAPYFEASQGTIKIAQEKLQGGIKKIIPILFEDKQVDAIMAKVGALEPGRRSYALYEQRVLECFIAKIASFLLAFYLEDDEETIKLQSWQIRKWLVPFMRDRLRRKEEVYNQMQECIFLRDRLKGLQAGGFVSDQVVLDNDIRIQWLSLRDKGSLAGIERINRLIETALHYVSLKELITK